MTRLRYHEIDLGTGSRAKQRYDKLTAMLSEIIQQYRRDLLYEYATTLADWRRGLGWRIAEAPHWTLELEPDEWQALSRGLRALGTPTADSMYQWLNLHRLEDHET